MEREGRTLVLQPVQRTLFLSSHSEGHVKWEFCLLKPVTIAWKGQIGAWQM